MDEQPWYGEGLHFRCTQCGNCCTGEPGAVWVTDADLQRIADHTGKSLGEVKLFHTKLIGSRVSLSEYANGDCTFFDGASRRCTIYPVRPSQCRTWPFWPGNVESSQTWEQTRSACPGVGRGDFVPADEILRRVSATGT
ncbi:MAG: YkgJ family cysteine cluster protein [Planctomycetaceae bacterium]